ncbi:MAG TPA: sigma factor-like helix-turn-helix DNA-binding protein [Myxococcota bacterium]|nr:sigma factor-like helix-turn-helix DNA-binding protein [Myxococcota bacterium]
MNAVAQSPQISDGAQRRAAIDERVARAVAAWPDLGVPRADLADAVDRMVMSGPGWRADLDGLRVEDLCLAFACSRRLPGAIAAFERAVLARVPVFLGGLRADEELVEATRQALREKLFVGTLASPPKIGQYAGRGSLDAWVRVAAVRAALNLREEGGRVVREAEPLGEAVPAGLDVELDYLRSRYRVDVAAALREAIDALPSDDRLLLRLRFVDGLLPGQIADLRGVHRTTVGRRLDALVGELLRSLRAVLHRRLRVAGADCDSLLRLMRSQVHLTLGGALRGDAA